MNTFRNTFLRSQALTLPRQLSPLRTMTLPAVSPSVCKGSFERKSIATVLIRSQSTSFAALENEATSSVFVEETKSSTTQNNDTQSTSPDFPKGEIKAACGTIPDENADEEEGEQEEMFVDPYEAFEHGGKEWGGPRRGGRFPEPTRYGDWERKGRCTDF